MKTSMKNGLTGLSGLIGLACLLFSSLVGPLSLADSRPQAGQRDPALPKSQLSPNSSEAPSLLNNPWGISLYKPNYLLPFSYMSSPDQAAYPASNGTSPLMKTELTFQFSLKYPLIAITHRNTLYLAYTQLSFWQAYQRSAFFRETNYEPEVFLSNQMGQTLGKYGPNFLNIGLVHQSDGEAGSLARSWNRAYLNAIWHQGPWLLSLKPWYIFHDSTYVDDNPDMASYMGYGSATVSYQFENKQEVSLMGRTRAVLATWSFPIHRGLKGYVQLFSGYGQGLIEYDHSTNSLGLGIAFNDW
jgi:phospholipase A1